MADPASDLRRVAGLVFDQAATRWYVALALEALSAVLSAIVAFTLSGHVETLGTGIAVVLLLVAYGLRLSAESRHEIAQTMNRQAALSGGLGWKTEKTQADEWRLRAGTSTAKEAETRPLDPGYYSTTEPVGAKRMAEMTLESAFYTRQHWLAMRGILLVLLVVALAATLFVGWVSLAVPIRADAAPAVAQVIVTVVLVAVSLDVLGWVLRLGRQESSLKDIIRGLDHVLAQPTVSESDVLRLVAEYDCETANTMPLLKQFLDWKHADIEYLWKRRQAED